MNPKAAEVSDWRLVARTDIVARILEAVKRDNHIGQDTILDDANLSRPQAAEYLSLMTRNELLKLDLGSKTYRMTRKGNAFL